MLLCLRCLSPCPASAHLPILPVCGVLEQGALSSPLLDGRGAEDRPDGLIKHSLQAALGQGRALQVLHRTWATGERTRRLLLLMRGSEGCACAVQGGEKPVTLHSLSLRHHFLKPYSESMTTSNAWVQPLSPGWEGYLHSKHELSLTVNTLPKPAFIVTDRHWTHTDLFGHGQALGVGDRGEFLLPELLDGVLIVPQIQLGAH